MLSPGRVNSFCLDRLLANARRTTSLAIAVGAICILAAYCGISIIAKVFG